MPDSFDLAALVASRICHDLISPIGAIGNGVELLAMERGTPSPEMQLLSDSVANATAQLRFLRIAFGAAGENQRIGRAEVASVLADLDRGGRIRHGWTSAEDLSRREVRLVFLLAACAQSALSHGGRVEVRQDAAGWSLRAEGPRLKIDPALWDALAQRTLPEGLGSAQLHFALAAGDLARQGRSLGIEIGEATLQLTL